MNTEEVFKAIFWTLLVLMFLMRFWFGFRVWRTGERILADRAAHQREGLWAHVVEFVFFLLLAAVVLDFWFQGGNLRRFAFSAPDWLRWAGVGLGITSVGLFACYCDAFRRILQSAGVKIVLCPPHVPQRATPPEYDRNLR